VPINIAHMNGMDLRRRRRIGCFRSDIKEARPFRKTIPTVADHALKVIRHIQFSLPPTDRF
jgi:hypothetical protein